MSLYRLNVCMPARDRTVLTKKCIQSIYENSKLFKDINIYVFDNMTEIDKDRTDMFQTLLNRSLIKYYSYDTEVSTNYCFAKPIIFNRWIDMMILEKSIMEAKSHREKIKEFYMLTDNDMIYGPDWDVYMVSAANEMSLRYKNIKYLVKAPGGVTKRALSEGLKLRISNTFESTNPIDIVMSCFGGGSGFWFMTYNMLLDLKWTNSELASMYGKFKGHDSTTWLKLNKMNGDDVPYVAAVFPKNMEENPLVEHLGSSNDIAGSICNSLTSGNYHKTKIILKEKDKQLENLSVSEIWKNNKDKGVW